MSQPFGYSYLLDMYQCKSNLLSDVEANYLFLEKLPKLIGMESFSPPLVIKEPSEYVEKLDAHGELVRSSKYPDKAGISGVIFLITSSIVLHTIDFKCFSSIDVYSCKEYDPTIVFNECQKFFGFEDYDHEFIQRGVKY